ncbi:MAG: hemerythrin [Desulfovibrionales bacterium]|nr:hemerythrin [Desulfovibrionales bacterium]
MPLFKWSESLSVGDGTIDSQHQRMIEMINELYDAMERQEGAASAEGLVASLRAYAREHFTEEEQTMERIGFPDLAAHREQHAAYIRQIHDYEQSIQTGESPNILDMSRFLCNWLLKHIKGSDQNYAPYLSNE